MGATASLAISTIATVSSVESDRRAADAAVRSGNYQGDIYELNATVAEQQRVDAIARGQEAESRSRAGTRQLAGRQRAVGAAQGLALDTGSIANLQAETAQLGELDALTIRNNAKREAWGFQLEAQSDRMSAELARQGGQNEAAALRTRGTSTLLTGGLQTYGYAGDAKRALAKRWNDLGRPKSRGGWGGNV